jgi:hypothetical protein
MSSRSVSDSTPKSGRPGLSPGRYFRLLLIGYFEGLDAERAIAWPFKSQSAPPDPGQSDRTYLLPKEGRSKG